MKRRNFDYRRWSAEHFVEGDTVVLRGAGSAVVYGCCRILSYGESRVCLARRNDRVCVWGEKLLCTSFSAGTVTVEGRIIGVRYCCGNCLECTEVKE